jgi:hypothetical protein
MRARRRTQKDGRGLEGALEGALEKGEGSMTHLKGGEGSKAHSKGGRVRKHITLGMEMQGGGKIQRFFFYSLILMDGLPRLKFLIGEKFSKAISILTISRWLSI